eukprot:TRINITY_DN6416_c0_g1_i1.p1 TRINITY_DN6416_c0_g1~~TRINITY_DN6416_c0_g1_i1.p1  ORF type:complete len:773 (+),score=231.72 TRINITY_DN6416_c0_g1_i1:99-2321(+)
MLLAVLPSLGAAAVAAAHHNGHPHFRPLSDGGFELSNGLCRSRWVPDGGELAQQYEANVGSLKHPDWFTLTNRSWYEVAERDFDVNYTTFKERLQIPGPRAPCTDASGPGCGKRFSGNPWAGPSGEGTRFAVEGNGTKECVVRFNVSIGAIGWPWQARVTLTLRAGDRHIGERVDFVRTAMAPGTMSDVRVRKVWSVQGLPADHWLSFWITVQYAAWSWPGVSFVVQTSRSGPWTPQRGGGGLVDLPYFIDFKTIMGPDHTVYHQAPVGMQTQGWISAEDLGVGEAYTLEQNVVMRPGYHFDREFLEHLWALSPPEQQPPRYSMRRAVDKMMYAMRYTTKGLAHYTTGEGVRFAFYNKDWYDVLGQAGSTQLQVEHSPDWGGAFDAWGATFLLLYKKRYGDPDGWIERTYQLLRNGFVFLDWNVNGGDLHGAIWQAWTADRGMHASWFLGEQFTSYLWVCDSGKTGYFFLRLYELTGRSDRELLRRAEGAGDFLIRIQQPSGDLLGSAFDHRTGLTPTRPANFAGAAAAILLWAKLYQVTRQEKWLQAAQRCTEAAQKLYLRPGAFQMNGGELDDILVNQNLHSVSEGLYGVMAFAELSIATGNATYTKLLRVVMDYMLAWQWSADVHLGYYNSKARFQGADFTTAGAQCNGIIRAEATYFAWLAYKATGDAAYLRSFESVFSFLTRSQWDNTEDNRFFGGGHEVINLRVDALNGFGSNFWGETVGQGVAILDYLNSRDE